MHSNNFANKKKPVTFGCFVYLFLIWYTNCAGRGMLCSLWSYLLLVELQYTVKNLKFILTVEPENEKTKQKLEWAEKQREANQPTVPSTIGDEFEINTFMRVDLPEIQVNLLTWNTFLALPSTSMCRIG
jgi:hypothetical protein